MTASNVDEYLAAASDEARPLLTAFREIIHELEPTTTETIKYGMPTFEIPGHHRIYLAAWAKHVGVYPVHPAPEPLQSELAPLRAAKDTVRFPLNRPVDEALARRLLAFLVERPTA